MLRDVSSAKTVSVNTAVGTTEEIPKAGYTFGHVWIPVGSSITSLTWHGAPSSVSGHNYESGTYLPAYDADLATPAAIVQVVAAGRCYPIPAEIIDMPFLKAVGDAAGDIIVQFSS